MVHSLINSIANAVTVKLPKRGTDNVLALFDTI